MPRRLHHDFETFSEVNLKTVGGSVYARHPSTELLMCAYAFDDGPVQQWTPAAGEPMPDDLAEGLEDPDTFLFAWNAPFERSIWRHVVGIELPWERWVDPMALAFSLALPGSLDKAGAVVGLKDDQAKLRRGSALIRRFCMPRKPSRNKPHTRETAETAPDEWEEFLEYNRRDVEAERAIWKKLRRWKLSRTEMDVWRLDQKINEAGLPVNVDMVDQAIVTYRHVLDRRLDRLKALTGLDNPNSQSQLLPWLRERGYPFEDLKKGHIEQALGFDVFEPEDPAQTALQAAAAITGPHGLTPQLHEALTLRSETSRTAPKKYAAVRAAVDADGALRGAFQYCGAGRTGRWSGRRYQPQNLARPTPDLEDRLEQAAEDLETLSPREIEARYDKPMDLLASCVRPIVQAPPGYVLCDADLNAIENRVIGWVADEQKILDVFRKDRDPYVDFAQYLFNAPYETLWREYKQEKKKEKRTLAKPGVLGCLAPETPVLTDSGWKSLADVKREDRVHDGVEFVQHGGVIFQGVKPVVDVAGVQMTPDHKILTDTGWRPAWGVTDTRLVRATRLALGLYSERGSRISAPEARSTGGFGLNAAAAKSRTRTFRISSGGSRRNVQAARYGHAARRSPGASGRRHSMCWRIGSTRSDLVARTRKLGRTRITADEASSAGLRLPRSLSNTSRRSSGLTSIGKSTASTTTAITSRATSATQRGVSRTRTGATLIELSTGAGRTRRRSSGAGLRQRMPTRRRSFGRPGQATRRKASSATRQIVGVRTVYDIVNAGSRRRFLIWSDRGPLIVHNCGYMLGPGETRENPKTGEIEATGLLGYAWNMGIKMTPDQSAHAVEVWRETYSKVVEFWWEIDRAAKRCVESKEPTEAGFLRFDISGPFMRMHLPSGRCLYYCKPAIIERETPWGEMRPQLTYMGIDDVGRWARIGTHPGKLVENAVQAIARDLLAHGMLLADREGLDIRMHVHDQIVALSPEDRAEEDLKTLEQCMAAQPAWAKGLPLKADGFISKIFTKD